MRSLIIIVITLELVVGIALLYAYGDYFGMTADTFGPVGAAPSAIAVAPEAASIDRTYTPATFTNEVQPILGTNADTPTADTPTADTPTAGSANSEPAPQVVAPLAEGLIELLPVIQALFEPLSLENQANQTQGTEELIFLGRTLFYDPRLSANQQMSCNTCHALDRYGVDNLPVSIGHNGKPLPRNAQSVYNSALHISQFWDGRSPNVEEQSKVPITDASEMGMLEPTYVEQVLASIPGYGQLFRAAFPNEPVPITFDNVARAIGAFERQLLTPARFDAFLQNDFAQLTAQEQRGLETFVRIGCANCHQGVPVGGLMYKRLGEIEPYQTTDLGRFDVTGEESDLYVFKVPSLRNVAYTGPYLHDGSIQTLEEMVVLMAKHQLGKNVRPEEVSDIVSFLYALTGELPADLIAIPALPPNGPNTITLFN